MKSAPIRYTLAIALGGCVLLAGCGVLKPTTVATRSFVLTPLPPPERGAAPSEGLPLAIAPVKLPSYLLKNSMAVRKGTNQVVYLEDALWAESLDQSFQRTLATNLGILLSTGRIRLATWHQDEASVALHVNVEQFDVDEQGRGVLHAWWRITSPGGEQLLRSGESRFSSAGPSPSMNPQAIASTLSEMTAELSRTLAPLLQQAAAAVVGTK